VVDSTGFEDRNYTNVNAHELAHQWFGDLVTAIGYRKDLLPL
jgi:aminopeptidase N